MRQPLIAAATIAGILLISEMLWHNKNLKGEFARKFVHIVAGTYIAFLPFILHYDWIMLFGVGFIAINLINRYTAIFRSIHTIKRQSVGDILFGLAVAIIAFTEPPAWVFTAAILHVSLADGFAAIAGTKYGKKQYKVSGHKKTLVGTSTFALTSIAIMLFALYVGDLSASYNAMTLLVAVPIFSTIVENVSGYGTDNLTVPLTVLALFNVMQL